jgi:peptide subunit release factor 1 (eRF1)
MNATGDLDGERKKFKCFNCGSEDHLANKCPKPVDQDKVDNGALAAADLDEAEAEDADAAAEEVVADVAEAMVGLSPVVMLPELTMMDFR